MNYKEKIDYSSLSTYLECPRKFMFQYIMHFRSARPSIHLVFGSCWHYGLEIAYNHIADDQPDQTLTSTDLREISIQAFNTLWKLEGEPHFDSDLVYPKSPGRAADMYNKYWKRFTEDDTTKKIIGVEVPFSIDLSTINPNLPRYIGRMDLVMEDDSESIEIIDHKTAGMITKITNLSYECSYQTDGYLTAGHLYYDRIPKIIYSVAVCQKSKIEFHRFTFSKRQSALDRFISDIARHIKELKHHINLMQYEYENYQGEKSYILQAFPRKAGTACTQFFTQCPYYDICNARNNPTTWWHDPPQGYSINEWDPDEHDANLKQKLSEVE